MSGPGSGAREVPSGPSSRDRSQSGSLRSSCPTWRSSTRGGRSRAFLQRIPTRREHGLSAAIVREVGLFSTAFGLKGRSLLYYDEIELCYRLERFGRRILYVPAAEVNHAIHAERLSIGLVQAALLLAGQTEAYFDLVHREGRFVLNA